MKSTIQLLFLSFVLLFSCSATLAASGFGPDDTVGTVNVRSNPVVVQRGVKLMNVGSFGLKLKKNDIVRTKPGGQAQINLKSGDKVFVASATEIELNEDIIGQEKTVKTSIVKLLFGKIRAKIQKTRKQRFQIKTATATIGVKGTDFITEYVQKKTTVGTLDGLVSLTANNTRQSVDIPEGKMASVSMYGELMPLEEFAGELMEGVEFAGKKMKADDFAGEKIEM